MDLMTNDKKKWDSLPSFNQNKSMLSPLYQKDKYNARPNLYLQTGRGYQKTNILSTLVKTV